MSDCTGKITADIDVDCDNLPVAGIEIDVVLINIDDIKRDTTTVNATNRTVLDNLDLKTGKTGYKFTGVKQSNGKSYELVKKDNMPDKWKHLFSGVIFAPSADNKLQLANLALGNKYVVVVEQKWKGADNADAFEVSGFYSGLELLSAKNSSKENDNTISFELGSADGFEEPIMPMTLLDTSYTATKTAFTNKFAA